MEVALGFNTSKTEDFFLKYSVVSSCEADVFLQIQKENPIAQLNKSTICVLNSGFCTGWISQVMDMKLVCVEASCKVTQYAQEILTFANRALAIPLVLSL